MEPERGLVVVVEDERAIAELERRYLSDAGFGVHVSTDGHAGLADIRRLSPVAAVIDVGLPGLSGTEIVRALRADNNWLPIIFVTAHDDEVDRIVGLELGADDYVTKPFSPRELVVRVRGLVRRAAGPTPTRALHAGDLVVDPATRRVYWRDREIGVTTTEFELLAHLTRHRGQVLSREQLLSAVWGHADYGGSRTVDVHVAQVRAKLGDPDVIRTVRGVGYALRDET
jgi:DNA-binding response OmpR family regulator